MVKATMEWVGIPILLYTRLPIESAKQARTIHGARTSACKTRPSPSGVQAQSATELSPPSVRT